jgi:hypothetical protein
MQNFSDDTKQSITNQVRLMMNVQRTNVSTCFVKRAFFTECQSHPNSANSPVRVNELNGERLEYEYKWAHVDMQVWQIDYF